MLGNYTHPTNGLDIAISMAIIEPINTPERIMTIDKLTFKLFGKKTTVYRALDENGEVVQVFETLEAAQAYVA